MEPLSDISLDKMPSDFAALLIAIVISVIVAFAFLGFVLIS
jgi:hypothetical protein